MLEYEIHGSKGGGKKPHTPVETPNNLLSVAYAKVLIAVAEGELAGRPTAQDIYLDGTPLANADGSLNFGGVKWEWRPGSSDQEYIAGLPEVSTEFAVNLELKDNAPWVRAITKTQLDAVRVTFQWPALMKQQSNGDTVGIAMDYAIDISTDGSAFVEYQKYTIDGKTNTSYERTHRVDLPKANTSWTIRARRITPDSSSSTIQDTINVKSYAEVVDVKQRYPNTALLYVEFDSRLFGGGNIPRISVRTKGRVIQVPSNYDPETRNYTGIWSGEFKWAWTDNPVWVFYDLVTQNRFGLGHKVDATMVDKWALYEAAQYCDVMVGKGDGTTDKEPRHTCNIYIQEKADAWKVLRDVANIFNAMTYWDGNKFVVVADKEEDITNIPVFSRSNVVDGKFTYAAADDKSIYTSTLVSYDDPENHYNTEVEATFETSQILRWGGDRQTELAAIGCTSRGEAQRKGKYTLITNMFNRSVTFRTGLQGLDSEVLPGKVIHVVDPLIGGKPFTGRIKVAAGRVITLDRPIEAVAGDLLYLTKKDGSSEARTIQAVAGNIVTVTVAYTEAPVPNAVWYLESTLLKSQLFRVVKISSPSNSVYEIEAVEYNESKYGAIDNGARLEPRPISVTPPGIQAPPSEVNVTSRSFTEQTMAVTSMTVSWPQTKNATLYEGQWKVGNGEWVTLGTTGALQFEVKGIFTGDYVARVRAINAMDIKSIWTQSVTTRLDGKVGGVPALASLTTKPLVFGIGINWEFPNGASDTARTEIMYSETPNFASAIKLGDFSYPTDSFEMHGLKAGQNFWFWGRLVDRTGNIGPWTPLETAVGVNGMASTDVDEYEEYFKDQINNSALGQELADRIDLIDGPPTLPGSVNERVKEVADEVADQKQDLTDLTNQVNTDIGNINTSLTDLNTKVDTDIAAVNQSVTALTNKVNTDVAQLNSDINQLDTDIAQVQTNLNEVNSTLTTTINNNQQVLQDQIDAIDMSNTMPYDPTSTYTKDQVVLGADRKLYQAKGNVPLNQAPPNTTYWMDIGSAVITADGLATRVTKTEQDVIKINGDVTAQSTRIDGLQSQVNGKADASAVTSLTTRVTTAEGKITANTSAITALTTRVDGKADASALNSLTTRVTTAEGKIDANATAITQLNTRVDSKADATAVTALTTRVTTAEGKIDANSSAITGLNATVGNIGGNGTNIMPAEYTVFTDTIPAMVHGSGVSTVSEVDAEAFNGYALKIITGNTTTTSTLTMASGTTFAAANMSFKKQKYIVSFYAKASVAGHQIGSYLRTLTADSAAVNTGSVVSTLTTTWARYSVVLDASTVTFVGDRMSLILQPNRSGVTARNVWIDRVMIEPLVGTNETPSTFTPGTSFNQSTANAAATQALTVRVTKTETDITAQAQQLTQLTTQVAGKADSSAVTALTTRVTTVEGKVDSQAQSITTLSSNLDTTNTNVAAAQQAANNANTLAGGKGKVIYGSTAPAVADRLSQNLWIDTANGNNTPKRWNGTTWEVVTDKAATDAAAAAANALAQVATKADASAVQALTTRVTTVEGKVDANAQSITNLNTSLTTTDGNVTAAQNAANAANTLAGGKGKVFYGTTAPAVEERLPQNLWIDTNGGNNTPKRWLTNAWVAVTDKVATDAAAAAANALAQVALKADASAVTALTTRVSTVEGKVDTQATQITNLTASIGSLSADNIVLDPTYNAGKSALGNNAAVTIVSNTDTDVPTKSPGPRLAKLVVAGTAANTYVAWGSVPELDYPGSSIFGNISVAEGEVYQISVDVHQVANTARQFGLYSLGSNAANSTVSQGWIPGSTSSVKDQWVTISGEYVVPATCVQFRPSIRVTAGPEDTVLYISNQRWVKKTAQDSATATAVQSLEARVTTAEGQITSQGSAITSLTSQIAGKADASALTALTTRVTTAEGKIDSQAQSITNLNTSLTTTNGNVTAAQQAADAANTLAGGKGKVFYGTSQPATSERLSQNLWIDTNGGANTPKRWNGSAWVAVTDKVATDAATAAANALAQVATKADASAVTALTTRVTTVEGKVESQAQSITNLNARVDGKADSTAVNSLTTRVTTAEGKIDTQGTAITRLDTSLNNVSTSNLIRNGDFNAGGDLVLTDTANCKMAYLTKGDSGVPAGSPADRLMTLTMVADATGWEGRPMVMTNGTVYAQVTPGEVLNLECYMYCDNPVVNAGRIALTYFVGDTGTTSVAGNLRLLGYDSVVGGWQKLSVAHTVPATAGRVSVYVIPDQAAKAGFKMYVGNLNLSRTNASEIAAASAIQSLDTRVTSAEGTITSQGQAITSLTNTVAGKADASALTALTTRVTTAEGKITTQAGQITTLTNQIAGKADASAVTALTTRVTAVEGTVSTQAGQITTLTSKVGAIGGKGVNLLPAEYGVFGDVPPVTSTNSAYTNTTEADITTYNGYAYKATVNNATNPAMYFVPAAAASVTYQMANMGFKRSKYILSYYAKASVAGHKIAPFIKMMATDGTNVNSNITNQQQVLTTDWVRYSKVIDLTSATYEKYDKMMLSCQLNVDLAAAGRIVYFDRLMIEEMVGDSEVPSVFAVGDSSKATQANATATQALTTRVTSAEGTITSQGQAITSLTSQIAGKADATALTSLTTRVTTVEGTLSTQATAITNLQVSTNAIPQDNMVYDPDFTDGRNTLPATTNVTVANFPRSDSSVPAGCPTVRALKVDYASSPSANLYQRVQWPLMTRAENGRVAVQAGETYDISFMVYREGTSTRQFGAWVQPYSVDGTSLGHNWLQPTSTGIVTTNGAWVEMKGSIVIPATAVNMNISLRCSVHADPLTVWVSRPSVTLRSAQAAAQAAATTALEARVTTAEGTLTTQAGQITTLTTTVNGKANSSTVTALDNRVTVTEGAITAQGSAITQVQSTLGNIGGNGNNLLNDVYSWITSLTLPNFSVGSALTAKGVSVAGSASGFGYEMTMSGTATGQFLMLASPNSTAGRNVDLEIGSYLVSMYVSGSVGGTMRISLYDGSHRYSSNVAFTTTRQRLTFVCTSANATRASVTIYPNMSGLAAGTLVTVDSVMVEKQIGTNTTPSPFVAGTSATSVTAQATAISTLDTKVTNVEGVVTAQATRLDGIYVQVNPVQAGDTTGYAGSTGSLVGVWSEQSARIEDGVATGQKIDTVQAQVEDTTNSLNKTSATVQQTSTAVAALDGKVSASWSVKLQVNSQGQYVAAGVGLGIENGPAGLQSTFLVSADKFAVVNGVNGVESTPFVVNSGQVFIKDAFIANGSITMLKIGDTLQSDNFVAGIQGWRLTKSGQFEINGHVPGQGTMVMTNRSLRVYDGNNVKRVQLGDLSE